MIVLYNFKLGFIDHHDAASVYHVQFLGLAGCFVSVFQGFRIVTILTATVIRKSVETVRATFRSLFLLMKRFVFPWYGEMSSDVIRRIMAVTVSQRLMSQKDNGKSSCYSSMIT